MAREEEQRAARLSGATSAPAPFPFIGRLAHRLGGSLLEPRHERPVELEIHAALRLEKPAHVLGTAIRRRDRSFPGNRIAVPVEAHGAKPSRQRSVARMEPKARSRASATRYGE